MDDQGQGDGDPPILPHHGEDDAEPPQRQDVSPDGIFVHQEEDEFSESANPESASPEQESSPGSSRETPMLINDDEHTEEAPSERSDGSQTPEEEDASDDDQSDYGQDDSLPEVPQDKDLRGGRAPCQGIPCQDQIDQYEQRLQQRDNLIKSLLAIILEKNARLRKLDGWVTELAIQVHGLKRRPVRGAGRVPRTPSPESEMSENSNDEPRAINNWKRLLHGFFEGKNSYNMVWRSSQQNLNMSVDYNMCHPQVRFIKKDRGESSSSQKSSKHEETSMRKNREIRATAPLPDNIIFQILRELLTFEGLIHCFSRLDPHLHPVQFLDEQDPERLYTGLKGKFYISSEDRSYLSLTYDTIDPQVLLAPLFVSRKFCWYGCHIFYGELSLDLIFTLSMALQQLTRNAAGYNTFAFSSLGELGRFAKGINPARWSRIQNIELAWIGSRCVRFNDDSKVRLNSRTAPLENFCEAASLKTICLHIRESGKDVIRRPYEPESRKIYMTGKTSGQPNYRMTRSMRATLGIDYLYSLRGLLWIHAYDLTKEILNPDRTVAHIRDQSFVIDLERSVTQQKVPARLEKSSLENLDPLFPFDAQRWNPTDADIDLVECIFSEDTGYDTRINDLDVDATSSQGTLPSGSEADDSEIEGSGSGLGFSDSEGDDSGSSGSLSPPPPGGPRSRVVNTPAPGADSREEEKRNDDHSGSDGDDSDSNSNSDDSFDTMRRRRLAQYRRPQSAVPV